MKSITAKLLLLLITLTASINLSIAQTFNHPGLLHDKEDITRMRKLVEAREQPSFGSWQKLRDDPKASGGYRLRGPFADIARDEEFRTTKDPVERDFLAAYYNALVFCITDAPMHGEKAMEIIRAYSDKLKKIHGHDGPLCAGLQGFILVNACELMRYCAPYSIQQPWGWTSKDTESTEKMFRNVFLPVAEKFYDDSPYANGNWGAAVTKMKMAVGVFCNDTKIYNESVDFYLNGNDNGTIKNYVAESGQQQETGRDQAHCMLGLGCLAEACEIAWHQGKDLYGAENDRLLKGYEYLCKFNLGKNVPYTVWKDLTGNYCNWPEASVKARGQWRSVFDIAYGHYVGRLHKEMPWTEQALEKVRPEGAGVACDNPGFGSFLFYRSEPKVNRSTLTYRMMIQPEGSDKWTELDVNPCNVDMHKVQRAWWSDFDIDSPCKIRVIQGQGVKIGSCVIRPLKQGIVPTAVNDTTIEFTISKPAYLSVEFDGDRKHNLHVFANPPMEVGTWNSDSTLFTFRGKTYNENEMIIWESGKNAHDVFVKDAKIIYFGKGTHFPKDRIMAQPTGDIVIPSNCIVYLERGAIIKGKFVVNNAHDVEIVGRGVLDNPLRGVEITDSKRVIVDGITVINPSHYTVYGGSSTDVTLRHIKSFSCKGWSDGFDLMCCKNVLIEDVFLRNSDDCIALYNHRWRFWGGTDNVNIRRATLWADVAHPINIGVHGDDRSAKGETLSNVWVSDCDILNEDGDGCLSIRCGDNNTVKNIHMDDIRVEFIENKGRLINIQTIFSDKYNRAPGRIIKDVYINNVKYSGDPDALLDDIIESYDDAHPVVNVNINK